MTILPRRGCASSLWRGDFLTALHGVGWSAVYDPDHHQTVLRTRPSCPKSIANIPIWKESV